MSEKVVGGLKWVKGEIALTLRRVRELVEEFGRTGERAPLGDAVEALFEVRGVLLALQLTLPARLVEEMQRLAEAMADASVRSPGESAEALMLALIQLPNHLDRLDAGAELPPLSLWPVINDLRESRGAAPLSQAELLVPGSVLNEEDEELPAEALEALSAVLRKVRPHFHRHLLDWYRPETSAAGLIRLGRLFHQVYRYLKDGILADLFRLAETYAGAVQSAQVAGGPAAHTLLGHLDRVLKPLAKSPPRWPDAEARALIDALLDALTRAGVQAPLIDDLLTQYGQAQVQMPPLEGVPEAVAGLAAATLGEIAALKERLDGFVRGARDDRTPLDEIRAGLAVLARTLDVAETGRLPERLRDLADGFGELAMADQGEDALRLEPLATELLSIEAVLQAYADHRSPELGATAAPGLFAAELSAATLRESRAELMQVMGAIAACQGEGARPEGFAEIPDRLASIGGALQMLGDDPAAQLAEDIASVIRRRYLATGRWPGESELPRLADAVAALELYLERAEESEPDQGDLLVRGTASVTALDRLPPDGPRAVPGVPAGAQPVPAREAGLEPPSAASPGAAQAPPSAPAERAADSSMAPELLAIFLEEADEEIGTAAEHLERWRANPADEAALSNLRRSFRTLKGSGRLVGAQRVGQLAQAAETVLERAIDGALRPDAPLLGFLADAIRRLPELVRAEAQGRPLDLTELLRRGALLARGGAPADDVGRTEPRSAALSPGAKVIPWPVASTPAAAPVSNLPQPESAETDEAAREVLVESADRWVDGERARDAAGRASAPSVGGATAPGQGRAPGIAPPGLLPVGDSDLLDRTADRWGADPARRAPGPPPGSPAAAGASGELADHGSLFAADSELLDIFRAESALHLDDLRGYLGRAVDGDRVPDETTLRALHTLSGSARMAGVDSIADVAKALEGRIRPLQASAQPLDERLIGFLDRAVEDIAVRLGEIPEPGPGAHSLARLVRDLARPERPEPTERAGGGSAADPVATPGGIDLSMLATLGVPSGESPSAGLARDRDSDLGGVESATLMLDEGLWSESVDFSGESGAASVPGGASRPAGGVDDLDLVLRDSDLAEFFGVSPDSLDEPEPSADLRDRSGDRPAGGAGARPLGLAQVPPSAPGASATEAGDLAAELERALGELEISLGGGDGREDAGGGAGRPSRGDPQAQPHGDGLRDAGLGIGSAPAAAGAGVPGELDLGFDLFSDTGAAVPPGRGPVLPDDGAPARAPAGRIEWAFPAGDLPEAAAADPHPPAGLEDSLDWHLDSQADWTDASVLLDSAQPLEPTDPPAAVGAQALQREGSGADPRSAGGQDRAWPPLEEGPTTEPGPDDAPGGLLPVADIEARSPPGDAFPTGPLPSAPVESDGLGRRPSEAPGLGRVPGRGPSAPPTGAESADRPLAPTPLGPGIPALGPALPEDAPAAIPAPPLVPPTVEPVDGDGLAGLAALGPPLSEDAPAAILAPPPAAPAAEPVVGDGVGGVADRGSALPDDAPAAIPALPPAAPTAEPIDGDALAGLADLGPPLPDDAPAAIPALPPAALAAEPVVGVGVAGLADLGSALPDDAPAAIPALPPAAPSAEPIDGDALAGLADLGPPLPDEAPAEIPALPPAVPTAEPVDGDGVARPAAPGPALPEDWPDAIPVRLPAAAVPGAPVGDRQLVALFLDDARDLLDGIDGRLREWQLAPRELSILDGINRLLHTLKGNARLTGLGPIGDLSHALETRLTAVGSVRGGVDDTTLELAQRAVDTLALQVDALDEGLPIPAAAELVEALDRAPGPRVGTEDEPDLAILRPAARVGAPPAPGALQVAAPAAGRGRVAAPAAPAPTVAQIRVRSDLLKRLVNNSGEISLYGARLAQRNGLLGYGLGELDQTVRRLREQLRHLEIETETQILHRFEREGVASRDGSAFDPLELDRFSTLQQLSRSLAETVSDLGGLRDLLGGYQRELADLLRQQERLAEDLQDGLLRTRMVPFVQIVPRLHRLVRQTADALGKSARLEVIGPEVELDRSILDRLGPPLEHLLRNAVDHGLESPSARLAAGKPAVGSISLDLSREGNDVVIALADDGRGLDLDAIRDQAVARGLWSPQAATDDAGLMQLVFEPGFTTLERVTQISGRGVGLDVVASEIRASNGTIDLHSVPGQGTRFALRLPLTLAIVEAFLVTAGEGIYAVPHATLEGAARIPREELAAVYAGQGKDFAHRGHLYRVVYLGGVLAPGQEPDLGERRWLPLLLARTGEMRVALQVDSLLESTRVLVKPLGHQLSSVRWLAGGTILPDGRVALILDALALLRSGALQDYRPAIPGAAAASESPICVLVVDDSHTVRRITSRLLRRQQIEVLTAKDGVEALTLLDERLPDLVLLDIEMPRMDGYELTRHIRRSERLRDLPIVMITSRAGDKHRDLARSLGVDRYLSKPYQESDLLDEIGSLLAERAS